MQLRIICFVISFCTSFTVYCQSVKDSFEVNGPNYKGYIMPLGTYYPTYSGRNKEKEYLPTKKEVSDVEDHLAGYLDSLCRKSTYYIDKLDCELIKKEFDKYFRQYRSYISTKNGHRYMYILCISPRFQQSLEVMKKEWMLGVNDGGTILFHISIDIDTGQIHFSDNGRG